MNNQEKLRAILDMGGTMSMGGDVDIVRDPFGKALGHRDSQGVCYLIYPIPDMKQLGESWAAKEKLCKQLACVNTSLHQLSLASGTPHDSLGSDEELNLFARNAGRALLSYHRHLCNMYEDADEN